MAQMWDAVTWANLTAFPGPFAAYRDGAVSAWPAEAFATLGSRIAVNITVEADEAWEVFDSEIGNAGVEAVATAVANRLQAGKWSWVYTNADNLPAMNQALRAKSVTWRDAQFWPGPGVYLWAAAPGTPPGATPPWCPVSPVAVQDRWLAGYDVSTLHVNLDYIPGGGSGGGNGTGGNGGGGTAPLTAIRGQEDDDMTSIYIDGQLHLFYQDQHGNVIHRFYSYPTQKWAVEVNPGGPTPTAAAPEG